MKNGSALGILVLLSASACAPVASSVPKMASSSPRTKDSIVVDTTGNQKFDLGIEKRVKVVSVDKYEAFEKKLDGDYTLVKFDEKDPKISELRELHALGELDLSSPQKRTEVVVVFVVKGGEKAISENIADDLKLDFPRTKKSDFSFNISLESDSGTAWSVIKANLVSVTVAYRDAKSK